MRRMQRIAGAWLSTGLLLAAHVVAAEPAQAPPSPEERVEPQHVKVQHILIGFQGSVRGKRIDRTVDEARRLAQAVYERARGGEDFDALVAEYTDDQAPGYYSMANRSVQPWPNERPRAGMVKAFGDVSFSLEVGEIGMAEYDPVTCRYGWHIIKRIE